jgi:hypothetical protein
LQQTLITSSGFSSLHIDWRSVPVFFLLGTLPVLRRRATNNEIIKGLLHYLQFVKPNISSSSVICQATGPKPLPKRFLHLMRSRASSFKLEYPLLSPGSSSNFLRLLPRLLFTSIFPSITCFRRQFLHKIWPIQLAFLFKPNTSIL